MKKCYIPICMICLIALILLSACKKFTEIDPPKTQIVSADVFTSNATATAALNGIYSTMMSDGNLFSGNAGGLTMLAGLSADEFTDYSSNADEVGFYQNSIQPQNAILLASVWSPAYQYIYDANSALEGLGKATGVTDTVKRQLTGEALFIRAFCHFYLVNLFGNIPIVTVTHYQTNQGAVRSPTVKVYQQIVSDLQQAEAMLATDFSFANGERVRPVAAAAHALLARVYLYTGNWPAAQEEATTVIANTTYFSLQQNLDSVFLANSSEAIFQLMPVFPNANTNEGRIFILDGSPGFVALTNTQVNAFETGDYRRQHWIDSIDAGGTVYYYPFKYKLGYQQVDAPTEYYMVLRLAEQYLIRAEAETMQGNIEAAQGDLNIIRNRAGLENTTAATQQQLLAAIQQERRAELFAEWGNRWFDLKRTGNADAVLGSLKPMTWKNTDTLYPIPRSEISNDPNLTQNAGY